jgi:polyisoprenoid-binding protein YceI
MVRNAGPPLVGNRGSEQCLKEAEMTTETMPGTSTWNIDPTHSIAEFSVKHLVVTTVKGRFRDFAGVIHIDEAQPQNSVVEATIAVATIDTNLEARDNHLRSDDFFNAEKFPYITFRSRGVERVDEERFTITGELTIRDVTREIELAGEYEGQVDDPWGNHRAAFTATTQISRKDFDVRWNQMLEGGGAVIGDNVRITLHIEAILER